MERDEAARELRREIGRYRRKLGLQRRTPCTPEENRALLELLNAGKALPEGIGRYKVVNGGYLDKFFTMHESGLSSEEEQEYLRLLELDMLRENAKNLRTIKNCMVFFTVLTVIGLVCAVISGVFAGLFF